jgi:hypothetical protein
MVSQDDSVQVTMLSACVKDETGGARGTYGSQWRNPGIPSPDRPARSQSLYRLSYPAHLIGVNEIKFMCVP